MGKVLITETILRDAHQSQAATRMRLEDMLPACLMDYFSQDYIQNMTLKVFLHF